MKKAQPILVIFFSLVIFLYIQVILNYLLFILFYIEDNIDDAYGINVQFEESEEEDDEDAYGEIREGDDHEDEGEESKLDATIHAENVSYFVNTYFI